MIRGIWEGIKANKGKVIKYGLIVLGAAVGLAITGKVILDKVETEEESDCDVAETTTVGEIVSEQ